MIRTVSALQKALLSELRAVADPRRAPEMQRYLKTSMPILGVTTPERNAAYRRVFPHVDLRDAAGWRGLCLGLFRGATFREEWWAAAALAGEKRAAPHRGLAALPMYEEMIVTSAWWDVVDDIATHRLSELLRLSPAAMQRTMRTWSRDRNLWKRRSAILCQIPMKSGTDLDLLYDVIEPSLPSREFFLRKAIGWALRQYAWTDPDEVVRYVRAQGDRLSPLSRREALKNVGPPGVRGPARRAPGRQASPA